jgi:hypothetical protein
MAINVNHDDDSLCENTHTTTPLVWTRDHLRRLSTRPSYQHQDEEW